MAPLVEPFVYLHNKGAMSRKRISLEKLEKFRQYFSVRGKRTNLANQENKELANQAVIAFAIVTDLIDCKEALDEACSALERVLGIDLNDPDYKAKVQDYARSAYNKLDLELRN